jgi:hypothetical protein
MLRSQLDKKSTARSAVQEIRRKRAERMAGAAAREAAAAAKKAAAKSHSAPAKTPVGLGSLEIRHTRERGRGITYELKAVLCGKKGCNKLHGPYWYAFWSAGGRVRSVYIGKKFKTVEEKCPERLKTPKSAGESA